MAYCTQRALVDGKSAVEARAAGAAARAGRRLAMGQPGAQR
jgi:hypothetical protein